MKRLILGIIVIAGLTAGVIFFAISKTNTCDTVISMAGKGATETEMISTVDASSRQPLNADDVIKLKHANVPNSVIFEMLHKWGTR